MEKEINTLSSFPNRIALIQLEPWQTQEIHRMVVKNFSIYFWVDEVKKIVQIIAIIYTKREQYSQLLKLK